LCCGQLTTPASFEGELRPYQQRGLAWLSFLSSLGLGACLADDLGLGKTPQTLALLLAEREQPRSRRRKRVGPTLLICPMSVVGNWQRRRRDCSRRPRTRTGSSARGIILAALMKLKQACNHPAHLLKDRSKLEGRSGKLTRLEEILAEALAEGDKALCFTQFAEFGHTLRNHLQERLGREVLFLHGGTSKPARDEMVSRFQADDGPPLFVLLLKADGTGLNLTAANHVVHFDRWWNPAVEDQATDRAFRIGQRKNVQVRKLTCVGTLEERIDTLITQKRELAERIVGSGERWITELDTAQLRELVTLSSEAVRAA
jgi:SNF2 family DNA or RNA helicase